MKILGWFNSCIGVIWLGVLGIVVVAQVVLRSEGAEDAVPIFLCLSAIVGLPGLLVVNVICLIVLAVAGPLRNEPDAKEEPTRERPLFLGQDDTLTEYMGHAEARGMSDDEIVTFLRRNGWSEAEIQEARLRADRWKRLK